MNNFSLYELLSYLVPGYVFVALLRFFFDICAIDIPMELSDRFEDSLPTLALSILVGICIHVFTFTWMGWKTKWKVWNRFIDQVFRKPEKQINSSEELKAIMPEMLQLYKASRGGDPIGGHAAISQDPVGQLFSHCYYYLEVKGKDQQVKSFQSFYFLLRNILTIELMVCFLLIAVAIKNIFGFVETGFLVPLVGAGVLLIVIPLTIVTTKFMRKKMIHRVFWSYYIDHIHPNK